MKTFEVSLKTAWRPLEVALENQKGPLEDHILHFNFPLCPNFLSWKTWQSVRNVGCFAEDRKPLAAVLLYIGSSTSKPMGIHDDASLCPTTFIKWLDQSIYSGERRKNFLMVYEKIRGYKAGPDLLSISTLASAARQCFFLVIPKFWFDL